MRVLTHYQANRDSDQGAGDSKGKTDWQRLIADDSLIWSSRYRLLWMLAIIVLLVAAILVAVAL